MKNGKDKGSLDEQLAQAQELADGYRKSIARLTNLGETFVKREAELKVQLEQANRQIAQLKYALEKTGHDLYLAHQSASWRVTKPLRVVRDVALGTRSRIEQLKGKLQSAPGSIKDRVYNLLRPQQPTQVQPQPPDWHLQYLDWTKRFDTLDDGKRAEIRAALETLPRKPLISVLVPTYNTPEPFLRAMIESVRAQLYPNWELCIADDASPEPHVKKVLTEYAERDPRIRVTFREVNGHISEASNSALEMARGEFVALLDHDDMIPEHALFMVVRYMNRHPQAKLFYSDEDKLTPEGLRAGPYFKSDWNPELILAQNMFSHFGVFETGVIRQVGGFRKGFEGSQDHDLILRCVEVAGHDAVIHIPHVLYHWRIIPGSTSGALSEKPYALMASIRSIQEHLDRMKVDAVVTVPIHGTNMLRVRYVLPEPQPLVSIIIPTRDRANLLEACVDSILAKTVYTNYEILIVDNGSVEDTTFAYFEELRLRKNVRVIRDDRPFNYSQLNNTAVRKARGEFLCLLNNDIEVISADWLNELVSHAVRPKSGCVGAALWYLNGTLQHGGVLVGIGDLAGHYHHLMPRGHNGYFGRAVLTQNVTAVTAACLVIRKSIYEEVGGFNEDLAVAFNDVDFCLRVRKAGYRNIYAPYAELYHVGSASRGIDHVPEKHMRLLHEVALMHEIWGDQVVNDPFYNPNLQAGMGPLFLPAFPPRIGMLD